MNISVFLGGIIGPLYLALSLSGLLYTKTWEKVMKEWEKNHFNMVFWAIMELILGLTLIQIHNIWEKSIWVVITVTGWGMVLEGLFYLLAPGDSIKAVLKNFNNTNLIRTGSLLGLVLGGYMSYLVYLV